MDGWVYTALMLFPVDFDKNKVMFHAYKVHINVKRFWQLCITT